MTRTRLVIPWWLGVLFVVVLGTLGWVLSRAEPSETQVRMPASEEARAPAGTRAPAATLAQAETPAPAETRAPAAYRLPETPHSARNRYARAEDAARAWQPDAALASAATSWSFVSLDDFSRPVDWTFQFFSSATGRVYTINVDQTSVTPVRETLSPYELSVIDVEHWQIDSYQAINDWLNQGGGAFLKRHPVVDVSIRLAQPQGGTPMWTVVGITDSGQTVQTARVDARGL
jgi:hypothetical protein